MLSIIKTMALNGLNGYLVEVQTDVTGGLPDFDIVGLPNTSIREAKERIRVAIKNSKTEFPSKRILINLSPAGTKKEGTGLDLPMAIGILIATRQLEVKIDILNTIFIGELSLNGKINKVKGILPMCADAKKLGITKVIIPKENQNEASIIKGIKVIPVESLEEIIEVLNGKRVIKAKSTKIESLLKKDNIYGIDFSDVKGQENIKRALEVAAAGGHNCLMIGSPGSGKTMLARRMPTILPDLTFEEALEITKIHSVTGTLPENSTLINTRPFRAPHHTTTGPAMIGGGKYPKPGEISLAHFGVLFLDELPEFNRNTLEVLRGPLEDKIVNISRVNASFIFPADTMLIASMNPCPCGYYGSDEKECICTPQAINRYLSKISGPLLDRIDIHIEVKSVEYKKISSNDTPEKSEQIKQRVNNARKLQIQRYEKFGIYANSGLTPKLIERYCKLDEQGKKLLENAFKKMGLSARAYERILKVARTIADLECSVNISQKHLAEAIQYRSLDRKYGDLY